MTVVLHRTLLAAMVVAGFGRALPRWDHTAEVPSITSVCEAWCGAPGAPSAGLDAHDAAAHPVVTALPQAVILESETALASAPTARPPLAVAPKTSPPTVT
jgi:hypothetical protein